MKNKIGVYICQCGSNISDYVDVEKVKEEIAREKGVVIAKTTMFACADSAQNEIIDDIINNKLDSMVVASCSPKLHLHTFRNVAERAGLNPYHYVQANIREQVSWAHSDNPKGATKKAISIVKAAIERVKYSSPLTNPVIPAENSVLVIGAGVAGLRAAIELADMGTRVILIEKEYFIGGRTSQWNTLFTTNETGEEVITRLYNDIKDRSNIKLFTGAEIISNTGSVGNFNVRIRIRPRHIKPGCKIGDDEVFDNKLEKAIEACPVEVFDEFNFGITKRKAIFKNFKSEFPECPAIDEAHCNKCGECVKICDQVDLDQKEEIITHNVGAIVIAAGFDPYEPRKGEFAYQEIENVILLQQFKRLIELSPEKLIFNNKKIKDIAYIYCVGSRQAEGENKHCSRYCCTSAIHTAILVKERYGNIHNFHFTRGVRTYGKQEVLYNQASSNGDIFLQSFEDHPPIVERQKNQTIVKINDILTTDKEIEVEADLVVLVTGMQPRKENNLAEILKVPVGRDKFFNEVHPKLKPVETVIDGVFICGACQAPFNITESVKSALSAASKANALLKKEEIELEPTMAIINEEACTWCGKCLEICPFDALEQAEHENKTIAKVNEAKCKGCGMCMPFCPEDAIELAGYTDNETQQMIEALVR